MKPAADDALDQELMAAVARHDGRAFARLVERHLGWSLGFVERMVGARHDAEDLVQTAFLRVWQGASRWEPQAKFGTWFYRVLYNLCMDHFRGRGAPAEALDEALPDGAPTSEERVAVAQRAARVRAALAALPERQRTAIVLCYYEERSQAEAAALLGVTEGALESLLSRARAALKKHVGEELH
jgi:RNA polymerase sigma-70 factor (ECF subfamily)